MTSQALFALARYDAAASAVHAAMQMLPQEEWGNVVKNYTQIYSDTQRYKDELRALENARKSKPDDPAMRFLLGYQYGYLGYPDNAVVELDKALELQPQDLGSEKLRDIFAVQAGIPARPKKSSLMLATFAAMALAAGTAGHRLRRRQA